MKYYPSFQELEILVVGWAEERGIFDKPKPESAALKMVSEIGELADGVAKQDKDLIIDAVGDVLVTLINLVEVLNRKNDWNLSMTYCLNTAYNEIKDRKGKMVNGTFVKE